MVARVELMEGLYLEELEELVVVTLRTPMYPLLLGAW